MRGATSTDGSILAMATTPTAVAPPVRKAKMASPTVSAHSAAKALPKDSWAYRRFGTRQLSWKAAAAWRIRPSVTAGCSACSSRGP